MYTREVKKYSKENECSNSAYINKLHSSEKNNCLNIKLQNFSPDGKNIEEQYNVQKGKELCDSPKHISAYALLSTVIPQNCSTPLGKLSTDEALIDDVLSLSNLSLVCPEDVCRISSKHDIGCSITDNLLKFDSKFKTSVTKSITKNDSPHIEFENIKLLEYPDEFVFSPIKLDYMNELCYHSKSPTTVIAKKNASIQSNYNKKKNERDQSTSQYHNLSSHGPTVNIQNAEKLFNSQIKEDNNLDTKTFIMSSKNKELLYSPGRPTDNSLIKLPHSTAENSMKQLSQPQPDEDNNQKLVNCQESKEHIYSPGHPTDASLIQLPHSSAREHDETHIFETQSDQESSLNPQKLFISQGDNKHIYSPDQPTDASLIKSSHSTPSEQSKKLLELQTSDSNTQITTQSLTVNEDNIAVSLSPWNHNESEESALSILPNLEDRFLGVNLLDQPGTHSYTAIKQNREHLYMAEDVGHNYVVVDERNFNDKIGIQPITGHEMHQMYTPQAADNGSHYTPHNTERMGIGGNEFRYYSNCDEQNIGKSYIPETSMSAYNYQNIANSLTDNYHLQTSRNGAACKQSYLHSENPTLFSNDASLDRYQIRYDINTDLMSNSNQQSANIYQDIDMRTVLIHKNE